MTWTRETLIEAWELAGPAADVTYSGKKMQALIELALKGIER
jgi:hypothetical protein